MCVALTGLLKFSEFYGADELSGVRRSLLADILVHRRLQQVLLCVFLKLSNRIALHISIEHAGTQMRPEQTWYYTARAETLQLRWPTDILNLL